VILDGENHKKYLDEEQINQSNIGEEKNKKAYEKISYIKDSMEQFFESISKDEL